MLVWCLVVYAVGASLGCFVGGLLQDDPEQVALSALFWPLLLLCAVVAAPFIGTYELGRWLSKRWAK